MATKTITLELDAYEKLKAAKLNAKESFSQVVRRTVFQKPVTTGRDLLHFYKMNAGTMGLDEATYAELMERQNNPVISPSHWDEK